MKSKKILVLIIIALIVVLFYEYDDYKIKEIKFK